MSSVKMVGNCEEGIYASSMLADIGIQRTYHGLTLSPKIQSRDVFFFDDTCVLGDDGFEDCLFQEEFISGTFDDEEQVPSASPRYQANHLDDFQPAKRRKLSSDGAGVLISQNIVSDTAHGVQSPPLKVYFPGSLNTDQHNVSEKEKVPESREQSLAHEGRETDHAFMHQQHIGTGTQLSYRWEQNAQSRSSASPLTKEHQALGHDCGQTTLGLADSIPSPVKAARIFENCLTSLNIERPESGTLEEGSCPLGSAASVSDSSGTGTFDPNVPLPTIERAYRENRGAVNLNADVNFKRIKYMSRARAAAFGLASGLFRAPQRTAAHTAALPPSNAPSSTRTGRDLDDKSRKSSQALQQLPTRDYLSDTSQEASTRVNSSESNPLHEIPAQLRRQFDALVKKFHTDQAFKLSVKSYMMEQNIPDVSGPSSNMAGTAQNEDARYAAEHNVLPGVNKDHDNAKDLIGCPVDEVLSKYDKLKADYLKLQESELALRTKNDELNAQVSYWSGIATAKVYRKPWLPEDPRPPGEEWKCTHRLSNGRHCNKWNAPWVPRACWAVGEYCSKCNTWRGEGSNAWPPPSVNNHRGVAIPQLVQDSVVPDTPVAPTLSFVRNADTSNPSPDHPTLYPPSQRNTNPSVTTCFIDLTTPMEAPRPTPVSGPSREVERPKTAAPSSTQGGERPAKAPAKAPTKTVTSNKAPTGKAQKRKFTEVQKQTVASANGTLDQIFPKSRKPWEGSTTMGSSNDHGAMAISENHVSGSQGGIADVQGADREFDDACWDEFALLDTANGTASAQDAGTPLENASNNELALIAAGCEPACAEDEDRLLEDAIREELARLDAEHEVEEPGM